MVALLPAALPLVLAAVAAALQRLAVLVTAVLHPIRSDLTCCLRPSGRFRSMRYVWVGLQKNRLFIISCVTKVTAQARATHDLLELSMVLRCDFVALRKGPFSCLLLRP